MSSQISIPLCENVLFHSHSIQTFCSNNFRTSSWSWSRKLVQSFPMLGDHTLHRSSNSSCSFATKGRPGSCPFDRSNWTSLISTAFLKLASHFCMAAFRNVRGYFVKHLYGCICQWSNHWCSAKPRVLGFMIQNPEKKTEKLHAL